MSEKKARQWWWKTKQFPHRVEKAAFTCKPRQSEKESKSGDRWRDRIKKNWWVAKGNEGGVAGSESQRSEGVAAISNLGSSVLPARSQLRTLLELGGSITRGFHPLCKDENVHIAAWGIDAAAYTYNSLQSSFLNCFDIGTQFLSLFVQDQSLVGIPPPSSHSQAGSVVSDGGLRE